MVKVKAAGEQGPKSLRELSFQLTYVVLSPQEAI